MNRLLGTLALAAALCSGGAAHAGLVNFDNPGLVDIDSNGVATYGEAGYVITGPAASFLPIDVAPYDLGFGPGTLALVGLVGGTQVASRNVDLTGATSLSFDSSWANLTSVSFSATGGFALDNIATVPDCCCSRQCVGAAEPKTGYQGAATVAPFRWSSRA